MERTDRGGNAEPVTGGHAKEDKKMTKGRLISAALCFITFFIVVNLLDIRLPENISPKCLLRHFTGWYCPGCGGTRALRNLLRGNVLISIIWHPVVIAASCLAWTYLLSFSLSCISKGKILQIKPRLWHFYAIICIILMSFVIKNILLQGFGISTEVLVEKIQLFLYNVKQ